MGGTVRTGPSKAEMHWTFRGAALPPQAGATGPSVRLTLRGGADSPAALLRPSLWASGAAQLVSVAMLSS